VIVGLIKPNQERSWDGKLKGLMKIASYLTTTFIGVMNMKKILLVLVLIFILLGTSQKVISFFEEETEVVLHENNSLYQLNVTTNSDTSRLIPRTALLGVNDTYEIVYKYEIYVEDNVDLLSEIKDLQILDSSLKAQKINDLFDFEISFEHIENQKITTSSNGEEVNAHLVKIYVRIAMNDLKDRTLYTEIAGKTLNFTYLLSISKA
jgi:hypothetical protein